ncbi:MAG: antibiotic biosynthesis monooxygenase [Chloroflexota bacterium]
MYIVHNRITIKPAFADDFEQRFAERSGQVDGMDGFVSFKILRHADATAESIMFVVQTVWESEAHFTAWTESDAFKAQHAQSRTLPSEAFLGRPIIEKFNAIQSTD